MPFSWAQALEQRDNDRPFLAPDHMASFRFLALPESPDHLPVGFARDRQNDEALSLTRLRWFAAKAIRRLAGAQLRGLPHRRDELQGHGRTDRRRTEPRRFPGFIEAVDGSLAATSADPAKWGRFAAKVLAGRDTPANRDMLKADLASCWPGRSRMRGLNATPLRYGYGRLDAFGHIFNKVSQLAVYRMAAPAPRPTPNPADAPVSYPFLWDIYRQSKLQWNGVVDSQKDQARRRISRIGALGRNTGEVIGVFGDVVLKPPPDMHGFPSSVQADNLDRLETVLRSLEAPKWPDRFGAFRTRPWSSPAGSCSRRRAARAATRSRRRGDRIYQVHMVPLSRDSAGTPNRNNTDPWMACNALSYVSASGKLQGHRVNYASGPRLAGPSRWRACFELR
jgi:hypothetical protein